MSQFREKDDDRNQGSSSTMRLKSGALANKRKRKKGCVFCKEGSEQIDYKQADRLKRYLSDRGKIVPRRIAGTCAKHHRELSVVIRRARTMALLPYVSTGERSERFDQRDREREGRAQERDKE